MSKIRIHQGDLPDLALYQNGAVAIDTETLGLKPHRDRLCVVQLSNGDGTADLIQIAKGQKEAPHLQRLLQDKKLTKIFHFGRFDLAILMCHFGEVAGPIFCTKIASRLVRTYSDRHGLKEICSELLQVQLSKQQQSSDWGAMKLSPAQQEYAAADVLYLHRLKDVLQGRLEREDRLDIAQACFDFLPIRARLDLLGWEEADIFAHS
ncbi:ribonuclease D [Bartonella sp. DGB2]|uniref:ribonuclease D n=1 Tax=Bartonella sp. DGB2 TaxID=3388426 RepID=UPI00398FE64F